MNVFLETFLLIILPLSLCFITLGKKINGIIIILSLVAFLGVVYFYGNHTGPVNINIRKQERLIAKLAIGACTVLLLLSIYKFLKNKNKEEKI